MWVGGVVNKKKNEGGGVAVRSSNQPSPASIWAQTVFLTRCVVGRISHRTSGVAEILPRALEDYHTDIPFASDARPTSDKTPRVNRKG